MIKKNPNFSGLLVQSMLNFRRVYQTKNIEARDQFWEFFFKEVCDFFIDNSVKPELSLIFYFNIGGCGKVTCVYKYVYVR